MEITHDDIPAAFANDPEKLSTGDAAELASAGLGWLEVANRIEFIRANGDDDEAVDAALAEIRRAFDARGVPATLVDERTPDGNTVDGLRSAFAWRRGDLTAPLTGHELEALAAFLKSPASLDTAPAEDVGRVHVLAKLDAIEAEARAGELDAGRRGYIRARLRELAGTDRALRQSLAVIIPSAAELRAAEDELHRAFYLVAEPNSPANTIASRWLGRVESWLRGVDLETARIVQSIDVGSAAGRGELPDLPTRDESGAWIIPTAVVDLRIETDEGFIAARVELTDPARLRVDSNTRRRETRLRWGRSRWTVPPRGEGVFEDPGFDRPDEDGGDR